MEVENVGRQQQEVRKLAGSAHTGGELTKELMEVRVRDLGLSFEGRF